MLDRDRVRIRVTRGDSRRGVAWGWRSCVVCGWPGSLVLRKRGRAVWVWVWVGVPTLGVWSRGVKRWGTGGCSTGTGVARRKRVYLSRLSVVGVVACVSGGSAELQYHLAGGVLRLAA